MSESIENMHNEDDQALVDFQAFFDVVCKLKGKGSKVLAHIVEKSIVMNRHAFMFVGTYADICKETSLSKPTVIKAMKTLIENNLLIQYKKNAWMINPSIMFYDKNPEKYMPKDDEFDGKTDEEIYDIMHDKICEIMREEGVSNE